MRQVALLLFAFLVCSCKSHKEIATDKSVNIDSIARSEHHRTMAVVDSVMRNIDFSFDTLIIDFKSLCPSKDINIERPSVVADAPEIIRIKAVKGRVIDRQRVQREQVEAYNRLDTVKYHQSAAEASTEHSATTRLYNPPDGTALFIIAILAIAVGLFIFFRNK